MVEPQKQEQGKSHRRGYIDAEGTKQLWEVVVVWSDLTSGWDVVRLRISDWSTLVN
jgi:hypothetical protein